jgi:hypothetical protein
MGCLDYLGRLVEKIEKKEFWTGMGIAYRNRKGMITVYFSVLSMNDKIFLIPIVIE